MTYMPKSAVPVTGSSSSYTPKSAQAVQTQPESKVPGWAKFLIPAAGSQVGAMALSRPGAELGAGIGSLIGPEGTVAGGALGGYGGSVLGSGVGAGLSQEGINLLEQLLGGNPPQTLQDRLSKDIQAGQAGATGEAIGLPLAKGLGFLAHPIASLGDQLDNVLKNSPAKIDLGQTLSSFQKSMGNEFAKSTTGREGQQAINDLVPNVVSSIKTFQKHIPAENPAPNVAMPQVDVASLKLPALQANQLKRNIRTGVNYQNPNNDPLTMSRMALASQLKDQIHQAVPGSGFWDKGMQVTNWVPNLLQTLTNLIPNSATQNAFNTIGKNAVKPAQAAIPQGGGYLKWLLPGLFSGAGVSGQNQ